MIEFIKSILTGYNQFASGGLLLMILGGLGVYMRLCGRPHDLRYVAIEFMLSMFPVMACWQEER
jgi:hypothetical protein